MNRQYLNSLKKPMIDDHYNFSNFANLTTMVNQAYDIFACYSLIKQTGMCDCDICFHEPFITEWTNYSDINAIPDEVLYRYFSSDVVDKTIVQQQMHALLPRLIDDFVRGKEFGILGRIGAFKWCQFSDTEGIGWRLEERQFMQTFALAYFNIYINHPDGWQRFNEFDGAIDIVTMFYMAGLNIELLLELWLTNLDKLLACLYLALIVRMDMEDGKFHSVFTENDPAYSLLINNWLNDNAQKITNALIDATFHSDFSSLSNSERLCINEALQYFQQLN